MTFEEACNTGKKIRREGWSKDPEYKMEVGPFHPPRFMFGNYENDILGPIALHHIFRDDWEIVE